jgi:hypothetical protein
MGPNSFTHRGSSHRLVFADDIVAVDSPTITAIPISAGIQCSSSRARRRATFFSEKDFFQNTLQFGLLNRRRFSPLPRQK